MNRRFPSLLVGLLTATHSSGILVVFLIEDDSICVEDLQHLNVYIAEAPG